MRATFAGLSGALLLATMAGASGASIDNRSDFEALVAGKELRAVGVRLEVSSDGTVSGRAYGKAVTGVWSWDDTYFCRDLSLGGIRTPRDCALVTVDGENRITFITNRGRGKSAWLRLR